MTTDLLIRDIITGPAVLVHLNDSLRSVAQFFDEQMIGAAAVRNTDPLAIISERDIVRLVADGSSTTTAQVSDVMTEEAWTTTPEAKVQDVAAEMLRDGIRHAPVLDDDGHVVGMISMRDVLAAYAGS